MLKNFVNKLVVKKNNNENKNIMIKKSSYINSYWDLENLIENKDYRYSNIKSIKIFNKGGFDHILKFKTYKKQEKLDKIQREFHKKFSIIKYNANKRRKNRKKYLIYPDSKLYLLINLIVGVAILYSVTFIPYEMAFLIDENYKWTQVVEYILDFIFIIDLLHNFFTAYFDRNFILIDEFKKIVMNYIFGWFILDFISSIPFSLIDINSPTNENNPASGNFTKFARFSKLPKILKVFRFAKLVKKFSYLKDQIKKNDSITINPAFGRLFQTLFLVSIFLHLWACLWYISATWFDTTNNWVVQLGYSDENSLYKYIASLYWVVQTVFTVGYGDFPAFNIFERILALISMFLGVFIYSFVVGSFSSLFFTINTHLEKKNKSLDILGSLNKKYKLSLPIYKEVKYIIEKNL